MTGRDLINASLRLLNVVATGENASAAEFDTAKGAFNRMVDSWQLERLLVYTQTRTAKVLTANVGSYTIGSGGDFDVPQPVRIENAKLILASGGVLELPLEVLTQSRWSDLTDKVNSGPPWAIYFQKAANSTSRGTIYTYYIPDQAHTLVLYLDSVLTAMGNYSDPMYLLPGYQRALVYSLAIECAAEFGTTVSPEVVAVAMEAKGNIKRANIDIPRLRCDDALVRSEGNFYDIRRGW